MTLHRHYRRSGKEPLERQVLRRLPETRWDGGRRRDVAVRSRHEQRWPGKLGRRQSTTMYDGRSAVTMTLSEHSLESAGVMIFILLTYLAAANLSLHLRWVCVWCVSVLWRKNRFLSRRGLERRRKPSTCTFLMAHFSRHHVQFVFTALIKSISQSNQNC